MEGILTDRVVGLLMKGGMELVLADLTSAGGDACGDGAGGLYGQWVTRVLTGSADLLSSVWYGEGVLASRVEGILGRMTVGRVELRPEVGRCASSVVTASTEACVSSCCFPDVRGGEGLESARRYSPVGLGGGVLLSGRLTVRHLGP